MRGMIDENGEIIKSEEEHQFQGKIVNLKKSYHNQYNELKDLKTEIERIQQLLERSREAMQKDFEEYIGIQTRALNNNHGWVNDGAWD